MAKAEVPPVGKGEAVENEKDNKNKNKTGIPKHDSPVNLMRTNDAFQPYRIVEACPPGTHPAVIDWPQKGDKLCKAGEDAGYKRPKDAKFGEFRIKNWDAFKPYKVVAKCPPGTAPVLGDWPKKGDMMCDRDWDIEEASAAPKGDGPYIYVQEGDKDKIKKVSTCIGDGSPTITNYPKEGDMACFSEKLKGLMLPESVKNKLRP